MSKKLYLLRHADAESIQSGGDDVSRPLSEDGRKQVSVLGAEMVRREWQPEFALSSSAVRTRETADAVKSVCKGLRVSFLETLYLASAGQVYEHLKKVDADYDSVLIVGHNPGLSDFLRFLMGSGVPELVVQARMGLRMGEMAVFECPVTQWSDLLPGVNTLSAFYSA